MKNSDKSPFYVGYLGLPKELSAFYKLLIPFILLMFLLFSLWHSISQKSAGAGVWDLTTPVTLSGVMDTEPYPVLRIPSDNQFGMRSVLLVGLGKQPVNDVAIKFKGKSLALTGNYISRGGYEMLEIVGAEAIELLPVAITLPDVSIRTIAKTTLVGEIVDSKCFLGVMKPGEGKTHKTCAALCLMGEMPPIFVVKNAKGERAGYLMANTDHKSAAEISVPHVAKPINITGQIIRRGDQLILHIDKDAFGDLNQAERLAYGPSFAEEIYTANSQGNFCNIPVKA